MFFVLKFFFFGSQCLYSDGYNTHVLFPQRHFVMCLAGLAERSGLIVTFNCLIISRTAILDTTIIQFVNSAKRLLSQR